jgi:HAD superfamily phosphoserine phosphatase-like hydrolase
MTKTEELLRQELWAPEIYERLIMILNGPPGVACFDWDETCASGDLGEFLLRELDETGDKWRDYEQLIAEGLTPEAYAQAAKVLSGETEERAAEICREKVELAISQGVIAIRPEIQALIAAFQSASWDVWVVTASTPYLVEEAALRVGVGRNRVLGMRLVVADGIYTGSISGPICYGVGKVEEIMRSIGRLPDFAAGDTWTDLEMLQSAKQAMLVGNRKPKLTALALEAGWICHSPQQR